MNPELAAVSRVLLEVAVDTAADAAAAVRAGADRLELCSALNQHGLSPSTDLTREVVQSVAVPVMAMVRPSSAGFVHAESAWHEHLRLAEELLAAGASGVMFGCLSAHGEIDSGRCREMVRIAGMRETVFHRAFDLVSDHAAALLALADSGVTRVLTAGMTPAATRAAMKLPGAATNTAPDAMEHRRVRLAEVVRAARRLGIQTIICGGIRASNVREFVQATGAEQVHSACRMGDPAAFSPVETAAIRSRVNRAS